MGALKVDGVQLPTIKEKRLEKLKDLKRGNIKRHNSLNQTYPRKGLWIALKDIWNEV